jgi:hypothetical protein
MWNKLSAKSVYHLSLIALGILILSLAVQIYRLIKQI